MEENPYAAPQAADEVAPAFHWRLLLMLPAVVLIIAGVGKFLRAVAVFQIVSQKKLPHTMYTEPGGIAVALLCLAAILILIAIQPTNGTGAPIGGKG